MTDVEGSSERWNNEADDMSVSMQAHNAIIERCVVAAGGCMLDGEGDSTAASFDTPVAALEAAGTIQQALSTALLPVALKVRIGLHKGDVFELSPARYGGAALCFLGRLHKAAHGGQILLSEVVASELARVLPGSWELVDLGDHVFRDFHRRRVFQASRVDLPSVFPPLTVRRGSAVPIGPGTTLFGRNRELGEARRSRLRSRLTSLVGPSGIGKTRLALEMSRLLEAHYRDGVAFVELAGAAPANVSAVVANALFVNPRLEASPIASLVRSLRGRDMLVVLDNCEHVADAVASLVPMLVELESIDVLITSRVSLALPGEDVRTLSPLALPDSGSSLESIASSDAVRLLVDRATEVQPSFALNSASAAAVVDVCRRLAGLPLDLELAAAALRSATLSDLVAQFDDDSVTARAGGGTQVRDGIAWSLDKMGSEHRLVLERLSVFPSGAGRAMLHRFPETVGIDLGGLTHALAWLVRAAIVQFEDSMAGGHYRVLEPIRREVLRRLHAPRRSQLEASHAGLIAACALESGARLQGSDEVLAVDELDRLTASLRAEVTHDSLFDPDRAVAVSLSLHEHCMLRMRYEIYDWVANLLQTDALSPRSEAVLLALSGLGAFNRGDLDRARRDCEQSISLSRADGHEPLVQAHFGLMVAYGFSGDFSRAQTHFSAAARWSAGHGRTYFLVNTLVLASMALTIQGDTQTATAIARRAIERAEEIANPSSLAWGLAALAEAERRTSPGAAHLHLDEALTTARRVRSRWIEGQVLLNLATLQCETSKVDSAAVLIDALSTVEQTGSPIHGRQALRLAMVLLDRFGRHHDAGILQWAARSDHSALPPAPDVAAWMDASQTAIAEQLGADVASALLARGRRTSDAELVTASRLALIEVLS